MTVVVSEEKRVLGFMTLDEIYFTRSWCLEGCLLSVALSGKGEGYEVA